MSRSSRQSPPSRNIGPVDRAIRLWTGAISGPTAIGTLLGVTGLPEGLAPFFGVLALYCFATAFARRSFVYAILGIDTRVTERRH
ncbi:MAG: DUF2892 domain-containing protein [Salinarchaeum sp.]